jgi:putative zinc finger protein
MNCEMAQAELKAYEDGELDRLAAWRVRRHVGRCAACAEELRMMGKLNALLLSADLVEREAPVAGRSIATGPVPRPASPLWKNRRAQWASAAAVVLGVILLTFSPANHSDALAAAVQALVQMKTWKTCHLVSRSRGGGMTIEEWLRVPDEIHHEVYQGGALTLLEVQNAHETWRYEADKGLAVHSHTKNALPQNLILGTALGPLPYLERLQEEERRAGNLIVHERQDHMPDGRPVRVIDIQADMVRRLLREPREQKIHKHDIVYLDALTDRLVRWDDVALGWTCEIVSSDQPLPDHLFTWQPPAGVKVVEFTDWWQARQEEKLAAAANKEGEVTVHAIDMAANGDVWLTVSGQPRSGAHALPVRSDDRPMWSCTPGGMTLTDERGRIYVNFIGQFRDDWPANAALIGFTPLEPRRPSDPLPVSFTASLRPDFGPSEGAPYRHPIVTIAGLAAPAPAEWSYPLMTPLDAFTAPSAGEARYADQKERASKGYREGTAW